MAQTQHTPALAPPEEAITLPIAVLPEAGAPTGAASGASSGTR